MEIDSSSTNKKPSTATDAVSEEDAQLVDTLAMLVQRIQDTEPSIQKAAFDSLRSLIQTATTSMTSVPKPLKYLRTHLSELERLQEARPSTFLADILSVLHMTTSITKPEQTASTESTLKAFPVLYYKLQGSENSVQDWGHEYVKHLSAEIIAFHSECTPELTPIWQQTLRLATQSLVPFFLTHNSEADACDLLVEVEQLDLLVEVSTAQNYARICNYLLATASYEPYPYNNNIMQTAHCIFIKHDRLPEAAYVAIRLADEELLLADVISAGKDEFVQKQVCYVISQYSTMASALLRRIAGNAAEMCVSNDAAAGSEENSNLKTAPSSLPKKCIEILRNSHYHSFLANAAQSFGLLDDAVPAKTPEDIYKSHLDTRPTTASDSPIVATANAIVNALINMGIGRDRYLLTDDKKVADSWIYTPKGDGISCAVAAIGCIAKGNIDLALSAIDRYIDSADAPVRAGALLSVGLASGGACIRDESDTCLALASDQLLSADVVLRDAAIASLMFSYAGTCRLDVVDALSQLLVDASIPLSTVSIAALAIGNVMVGSGNGEVSSLLLQVLMERAGLNEEVDSVKKSEETKGNEQDTEMNDEKDGEISDEKDTEKETDIPDTTNNYRLISLALGLLYWGKQEAADIAIEAVRVLNPALSSSATNIITGCAYAGTGNVLQIQSLLHQCSTSLSASHFFSCIAIALISCAEEIGSEMSVRLMNHLMYYGNPTVKRAIPLAFALLSPSNPQMSLVDLLSKYSHDGDKETALGAILAMGIVGAGTSNSRISNLLRSLSNYYYKDQLFLAATKLSQGILHASRGLFTLSALSCNRSIVDPCSLSLLLSFVVCLSGDAEQFVFGSHPYLSYLLAAAMKPRYLTIVNSADEPVPMQVRVGSSIDTVTLAGTPKSIATPQTQTTPTLLAYGMGAEIAAETWTASGMKALTGIMEGVIVSVEKKK